MAQRYSGLHRASRHPRQSRVRSRKGPHLVHDPLYRVGAGRRAFVSHFRLSADYLHFEQAHTYAWPAERA